MRTTKTTNNKPVYINGIQASRADLIRLEEDATQKPGTIRRACLIKGVYYYETI